MLFNSTEFIFFFTIVFFSYWFLFSKSNQFQNILILFSSYLFYAWWDLRFLVLIIISSLTDFLAGIFIQKNKKNKQRKSILFISLFTNLGILFCFKYFNFFIDNFLMVLKSFNISTNIEFIEIILPIGISFYTFQSLSYTIDVYNKKINATNNIIAFFAFVSFFPQLVAGPIERAKNLLPQFCKPRVFDYEFALSGCKLILIGLFKKMVIADSLSIVVDMIYANPADYLGLPTLIATVFFAFQIYCDFSGYSDIAIGLARLLGFKLMLNFDTPYFSKSLSEFWRRWHISLSSWFRDYVYIPLGGSRVSETKVSFNIMVTFLLSGLWHGANWTFILWGALHGLVVVIEKQILTVTNHLKNNFVIDFMKISLTFSFVCITWIFFRSETIYDAFLIFNNLFIDIASYTNYEEISLKFRGIGLKPSDMVYCLALIIFLITIEIVTKNNKILNNLKNKKLFIVAFYYILLIFILIFGTQNNANNFIYFQF